MRMMLLTGALGVALAGPTALPATAADPAEINLDMVATQDSIWYEVLSEMAEAVQERTGTVVNIRHSGTTGSWREQVEALRIGTTDMVLQSIGVLDRYCELPGIEAYPFLLRDVDHFRAVYYGDVGEELYAQIEEDCGFTLVGAAYRGARQISSNVPVRSLDDVRGLKIRVPPLRMYQETWNKLDANGTGMVMKEVFTALQQGVIDAQENPIETIHRWKLHEVQDTITMTRHVVGIYSLITNTRRFDSFSPELQAALREEGAKAMQAGTEAVLAKEDALKAELQEIGIEFIEVDTAPFREAVAPIKDEFPVIAPWVDRIQAVQ
ncbi:MAG: TRAP transporter substrate-binding protein [Pseudomonadota bacterium]